MAIPHGGPDPRVYVLPGDPEFRAALRDPAAYGIAFVLVPPPGPGPGPQAATTRLDPAVWRSGDAVGRLVPARRTARGWRLYRVVAPPPP